VPFWRHWGLNLTSQGGKPTTASEGHLPISPRILYAKNPLVEVICQVRFPPVLRIDSEIPAAFQESIRESFPLFSDEESPLLSELPKELLQFARAGFGNQLAQKTWRFASDDSNWIVSLTRESFALATNQYSRWEDFRARLSRLLDALQAEYKPSFFTRVGLRYQNLIVRSKLELDAVPWSELLRPPVAAEFSDIEMASAILDCGHRVLISLAKNGVVNLRHGTARQQGVDEESYLIDNDFFTEERMEVANAIDRLDIFNGEAGRLFRWCISDRLHESMGPSPHVG
jgi:uncharacterized protein (TIGR04255 family)